MGSRVFLSFPFYLYFNRECLIFSVYYLIVGRLIGRSSTHTHTPGSGWEQWEMKWKRNAIVSFLHLLYDDCCCDMFLFSIDDRSIWWRSVGAGFSFCSFLIGLAEAIGLCSIWWGLIAAVTVAATAATAVSKWLFNPIRIDNENFVACDFLLYFRLIRASGWRARRLATRAVRSKQMKRREAKGLFGWTRKTRLLRWRW